jgi:hypothetical protein
VENSRGPEKLSDLAEEQEGYGECFSKCKSREKIGP